MGIFHISDNKIHGFRFITVLSPYRARKLRKSVAVGRVHCIMSTQNQETLSAQNQETKSLDIFKHISILVSDNRNRKPFKMPDHLGGDMRKVKVEEKEKEEKEIKGNFDFV